MRKMEHTTEYLRKIEQTKKENDRYVRIIEYYIAYPAMMGDERNKKNLIETFEAYSKNCRFLREDPDESFARIVKVHNLVSQVQYIAENGNKKQGEGK